MTKAFIISVIIQNAGFSGNQKNLGTDFKLQTKFKVYL